MSDIRGVAEMFGAGGGGGAWGSGDRLRARPGAGGDGIGGFGAPEPWLATDAALARCNGRDGFGGGGGGRNNTSPYPGARGGSGCVIVRLSNVDAADPAPSIGGAALESATFFDATLSVTLAAPGAGQAAASVLLQVAENAADLADAEEIPASAGADGLYRAKATGLRPAHAYVARFVARNAADEETATTAFSFVTPALAERALSIPSTSGYAGLWQYSVSGSSGLPFAFDETSEGLVAAPGAMLAGVRNPGSNQSSCPAIHGASWTDGDGTTWQWNDNRRYGYVGWMWMEAGSHYNFFEQIWDSAAVAIDGADLFRDTTARAASVATYECSVTGWHKIQVWLGGSNSGAGCFDAWRLGFGWNLDGDVVPWPDTDGIWPSPDHMTPLENVGPEAYLVRETPWRDVAISSYAPGASGIDFSVALGASDCGATTLWCAWGDAYGGEDTNAWTHVEPVDSGAAFDAASQTASHTLAGTTGSPLVRFFALHGDGTTSWSGTARIDLENVSISDLGVDHDGDEGTFSVRVGGVGSGAFSLALQIATDSAFQNSATNVAIAASSPGDYAATVPLTPGTTYWYRFAATDGSSSDTTDPASFTTAAGVDIASNPTASVTRHKITVNGHLDDFGAGPSTTVEFWYGDSADSLAPSGDAVVLATGGAFSISATIAGDTRKIYWKLVATNTARRGTTWTDETAVDWNNLNEDSVSYTWKADVREGEWADRAGWSPNVATNDCQGWPVYDNTDVKFANGSDVRIHVSGSQLGNLRLDTTGSRITLVGDGADVSYLRSRDASAGAMNGTTVSFDNLTVEEMDMFDWSIGLAASTGARLVVTNGGVLKMGGHCMAVFGTNCGFTVRSGSAVYHDDPSVAYASGKSKNAGHLLFGAAGESLLVDDGLFSAARLHACSSGSETNQSFRIRGPGGQIRVTAGVFGDSEGGYTTNSDASPKLRNAQPFDADLDVIFEPVAGAYTNTISYLADGTNHTEAVALVSVSDDGRALGEMQFEESVGKIRLSVDMASMHHSPKSAKQHFVLWKNGIDTEHVELVQGDGYTLSWTYGWPSVLAEPENAGDLPTGVWADVPAQAGTMILIK